MKKVVAVGVIVLFLGLAIAPSINANVSKESELVEITTEVCGLNGGKRTVQLTKEEAEEIDILFENIRLQLNESTSREEVEEIFNDAVVELDKYGLLGGLSVKQAQKLVTGRNHNFRFMNFFKKLESRNLPKSDANSFCLITGKATEIKTINIFSLVYQILIFQRLRWILGKIFFWFPLFWVKFLKNLALGATYEHAGWSKDYYPSEGWIFTAGLNGIVTWEGRFFGEIREVVESYISVMDYYENIWYTGIILFTGLQIYTDVFKGESFIIGGALLVNLGLYS